MDPVGRDDLSMRPTRNESGQTSVHFFSLLYIDQTASANVNLSTSEDPIDIYVSCATTLAASLQAVGQDFTLLTNDPRRVASRLTKLKTGEAFRIECLEFTRDVPRGIPFYSAHFKLDVFKYLSGLVADRFVCLVDLDVVMLKNIDIRCNADNALFVYDITNQVSDRNTVDKLLSDVSLLCQTNVQTPAWYGGEFVIGLPPTFRMLAEKIDVVWPHYCANINAVHHVGDEMVVTAALTLLRADGIRLIDAGAQDMICRWWTARTLRRQVPFSHVEKSCLLHLPSDKIHLAKVSSRPFSAVSFLKTYRKYAQKALFKRRLANRFLNVIKSERKFVADLD